jgi:hypothetical protein
MAYFANESLVIVFQTQQRIALALWNSEEECSMRVNMRQILWAPLRGRLSGRFAHHLWLQKAMRLDEHTDSGDQRDGHDQHGRRSGIDGRPRDFVFMPDTLQHGHDAGNNSQKAGEDTSQNGGCGKTGQPTYPSPDRHDGNPLLWAEAS